MGREIPVLMVTVLDKRSLKSNNYYLMVLIGRMEALKVLKLHRPQTR